MTRREDLQPAPDNETLKKMAIAFVESPVFQNAEIDHELLKAIRRGHAIFKLPDLFQLTQEGWDCLFENDLIDNAA